MNSMKLTLLAWSSFLFLFFCIENTFFMFGERVVSSDSWHSYGYQLCSLSHRRFCYSYEADFTYGASKRKGKRSSSDLLILRLVTMLIASIILILKDRISQIQRSLSHTLIYTWKLDSVWRWRISFYGKTDDFNFPIVNIKIICCNIPKFIHRSIFLNWCDIPRLLFLITMFLTEDFYLQRSYLSECSLWSRRWHIFEGCMVTIMTRLTLWNMISL